ncbi:hypothetical protein [Pedobacter rhizosphaerae]|uniref:Uncharacterized protein n=1 Tax=Pedobacter rhizosphaerae TaxID=390241 RepID=A0A1H9W6Q6_9SPHI|nr:hypothetical protein [Pedobacter rhizosphaerae]SES29630.1 hypothetical protein SAMN04488023_16016 [Pedobacter rhizosphaerae]
MYFKSLLTLAALACSSLLYAQNKLESTGMVGVGTLKPTAPLTVHTDIDSRPNWVVGDPVGLLKLSRIGTLNASYNESAEFRIGHGGPQYWGSKLDLYINGGSNTNNIPDQHAMTWQYNGNVGIGTTNPTSLLQLGEFNQSISGKQLLIPGVYNFERVQLGQIGNGNVALEMVNHNSNTSSYGVRLMTNIDNGAAGLQFQYAPGASSYEALAYQTAMVIDLNGQVGIGTLFPREKLSVNGNIRARELKVETNHWPDYVFNDEYKVLSLADTEKFIKANKHLPGMPTAKALEEQGVAVSEMLKLQQKKIEELTLHLIDKEKQMQALQNLVEKQSKILNKIQEKVSKAENHK